MPDTLYKSSFAFAALFDEATGPVATNRTLVVRDDSKRDAVKFKFGEGVAQHQVYRFSAEALTKPIRIIEAYGKPGAAVVQFDLVESDLSKKPFLMFDDPSKGACRQRIYPTARRGNRQRTDLVRVKSEHSDDLFILSESVPFYDIALNRTAETQARSDQFRKFSHP